MKKIYFLLFLVFCIGLSCEKDDICPDDTVTTPQLTIAFYSVENIEDQNPKNVFRFRAQGVDNDNPVPGYEGTASQQQILLPLKTTTDDPNGEAYTTEYILTQDYRVNNGTVTGNEDVITISYTTSQVYVSRGCGFKSVFENITLTVADDGDNWIRVIQSTDDNQIIADESKVNFNIYH